VKKHIGEKHEESKIGQEGQETRHEKARSDKAAQQSALNEVEERKGCPHGSPFFFLASASARLF
jgi:hypothetical protein